MNLRNILTSIAASLALTVSAGVTIHGIGDSTMATKDLSNQNPERGWGHMFNGFLDEDSRFCNHAVNGRSTKTFLNEGHWDTVKDSLRAGDYVVIQFGHNDASNKGERATVPGGDFDENLRRYIAETRAKGAIPVLFTPIARRKFYHDSLVDTHGAHLQAVRNVAAEQGVVCIDLNKATTEWIKNLGDEASKRYFLHVAPGTNPKFPEGRKDNTHLNVAGARIVARMAADSLAARIPEIAPFIRKYDIVVAKDGSGDFFTVQEAINAAPNFRNDTTTILVCDGLYNERVTIPANKTFLKLIGRGNAIISYPCTAHDENITGDEAGTYGSASVYIFPDDFTAENITFQNLAGVSAGQAVAVLTGGDRMFFKNCRFLGFQDTLFAWGTGRQYYQDCHIEGSVDFIFGPAVALFKDCEIRNNREKGYITAPSTPQGNQFGFVFLNCRLTANDGCNLCWLSRPWREYGQTVFIGCEIGSHIRPEGWHNWRKPERERTAFYAEYANTGDGADTSRRAFGHVLTPAQAEQYTPANILSNWTPAGAKF